MAVAVPSVQLAAARSVSAEFRNCQLTPRTQAFEEAYKRTPRCTVLGHGAFGVAFAVQPAGDPSLRYVAKEIPVMQLSQRKRQEALRESELLQKLGHRNIVACIDAMLTGSCLYIIMEFAHSGDLARHIRAQRGESDGFSEAIVMGVFVQICSALQYVHARRILHRDLKPANIFVFGSGELSSCEVKLGDFGLGKVFEATTFEAYSTVGSPLYFSPEICRGRPYGRKSDVWSLGVILYEMAALVVPFNAKIAPAIASMICRSEPKPLPERFSVDLRQLVTAMLRKDPNERPSAAAVLAEPFAQRWASAAVSPRPGSVAGRSPRPASVIMENSPAASTRAATPADTATTTSTKGMEPMSATQTSAATSDAAVTKPDSEASTRAAVSAGTAMREGAEHDSDGLVAVLAAFKEEDDAGRGKIPVEDLLKVLALLTPEIPPDALEGAIEAAGTEHDGSVDYERFLEWLKS